jgi:hypothetical protein
MEIAHTLYKLNPEEPAQQVLNWEKIAKDSNEFSDITNRWNTSI